MLTPPRLLRCVRDGGAAQDFGATELEELLSLLRVSARSKRKVRSEVLSWRQARQRQSLQAEQSHQAGVWDSQI